MCQQIAILATQEFTNCPSSESTMRQQLNSLESYRLSEDACMEIYRIVIYYKLDALLQYYLQIVSPSVTLPAVLPTVVLSLVEIQSQLA